MLVSGAPRRYVSSLPHHPEGSQEVNVDKLACSRAQLRGCGTLHQLAGRCKQGRALVIEFHCTLQRYVSTYHG